jgi:eukaryotic-like serine/threonine-protein kinase
MSSEPQGRLGPRELLERARMFIELGRDHEARADLDACRNEIGAAAELELALLDIRQRADLRRARDLAASMVADSALAPALRARAGHVLGLAEGKLRRTKAAVEALLAALELYRKLGERRSMAHVRDTLGMVFAAVARFDIALGHFALALIEKSRLADLLGVALTLGNIGRVHLRTGSLHEALDCFEQDLELSRTHGDVLGVARMLNDLGRVHLELGDFDEAERLFRDGLIQAGELGNRPLQFFAHKDLALLHVRRRDWLEAEQELQAAESCLQADSEGYLAALLLAVRAEGLLARADKRGQAAMELAVRALAQHEVPHLEIPALMLLADSYAESRHKRSAEACLARAMKRARGDGYARYLPRLREAMARLQIVEGALDEQRALVMPGDPETTSDGYVVLEELGRGGYGRTFRAFDPQRDQIVAFKHLLIDELYDPAIRRRLIASACLELEAASRVRHPGIARVLAVGVDPAEHTYVVQEFVQGETLRQRMRSAPTADARDVARVVRKIAHALQALHDVGVVHRDIKPDNILLKEHAGEDQPVLIDFGIAQCAHALHGFDSDFVEGTFEYMSPEQAAGGLVDGRSDVYSLGALAYEWLTGERPFRVHTASVSQVAAQIRAGAVLPLRKLAPSVPGSLATLIESMLHKRAELRPTASAVAEACERL